MKFILCLAVILSLALLPSCKKDCLDPTNPECANFDPCLSYEPANAGFEILKIPIRTQGWDCDGKEARNLEFEVDTVFGNGGDVYFRADQIESEEQTNITYQWIIGTDSRTWTTREFKLGFAENAAGDVPITLIVEKADPNFCGGTDNTRDTLTKNLHIKRVPDDIYTSGTWSLLFGKWQGYNTDNQSDTFQIELKPTWELHGLIDDCVYGVPDIGISFNFFYVQDQTTCAGLCGVGTLSQDRSELTFDYSFRKNNVEYVYRTFKGTKLPE